MADEKKDKTPGKEKQSSKPAKAAPEPKEDSFLEAFMEEALKGPEQKDIAPPSGGTDALSAELDSDGLTLDDTATDDELLTQDEAKAAEAGEEKPVEAEPVEEAPVKKSPLDAVKKLLQKAKKNPKALKFGGAGAILLVVLVVVLIVTGVFGGGKKPEQAPAQAAAKPAKKAAKPTPTNAAEETAAATTEEKPEETAPAGPPPRADDVLKWDRDQYLAARAEGDPRLIGAVQHLGKHFVRNALAAQLLVDLLAPPPEVEQTGQPKAGAARTQVRNVPGQKGGGTLLDAVVAALEANGSNESREILQQLLANKLPVEDDKTTVEVVLATLADHPSINNERIFYRLLTDPKQFRPAAGGAVTADDLLKQALEQVQPVASAPLRTALARYLCGPAVAPDHRKLLGEFLEEDAPQNIGAQIVFLQSPQTDEKLLTKLEEQLANFSSQSLAKVLGVEPPATAARAAAPGRRPPAAAGAAPAARRTPAAAKTTRGPRQPVEAAPDPTLPYRTAAQLWSPETVAIVGKRLEEAGVDAAEKHAELLALAATIPSDALRSPLQKVLLAGWEGGSDAFKGIWQGRVTDPGLLILVKSVPREEPKGAAAGVRPAAAGRPKTPVPARPARPGPGPKPAAAHPAAGQRPEDKLDAAKADWMEVSKDLVRAWCDALHAAATKPDRPPIDPELAKALPIELFKDATVSAEYHVRWPYRAPADPLGGLNLSPIEIHYVRVEQVGAPRTIEGFYSRQLQSRDDPRPLGDGFWMESFRPNPDRGSKRSIDVVLQASAPDPDADASAGVKVTVEILSIEIKDPSQG